METTDSTSSPEKGENKYEPWGDVSDPNTHNPGIFRYLVHGINPIATVMIGSQAHTLVHGDRQTISPEDGDQSINLSNHPEDLGKRVSLSCSLIDQNHYGTWGAAGLIVEAPPENVCVTSPGDMGASGLNRTSLIAKAEHNPILTAERLLDQTHSSSYNEVVVLASRDDQETRLAGFFYKVTEGGEPMDESLAQTMKSHAVRLHLPIVAIPEPNIYAGNNIDRRDNKLHVQFNGKLYWLNDSEARYRFHGTDQRHTSEFIDPETMVNILNYLEKEGLDPLEIKQLREEYALVDKERQKPRVKFDKQGEVDGIEKSSGYGKTEKRMRISKIGYAHWAYFSQEKEQFSRMFASGGTGMMDYTRPTLMLSPQEVENIVQEAIESVSDEEKTKIRAWYNSIKENVAKYCSQNNQRSNIFNVQRADPELNFYLTKFKEFPKKSGSQQQDKGQQDKGKS